jgi:ATP synthase protein I
LATSISSKEFCSVCGIDAPHHAALSKRGKKWLQGRFHQENQTFLQVRFDSVLRVWYPLLVLEGQAVHPQIRWILRWQLIVAMVAGFMTAIFFGVDAAVSAVLGGGIAMASGFAYAWRAFRPSGPASADAKKAYNAQVAGEGYKFAVTLVLFALVFKVYAQLVALPLFLTYVATVVVYWMALLKQR